MRKRVSLEKARPSFFKTLPARFGDSNLEVIFEDLHRIDEETQAFLNLLADSLGTPESFC